MLIDWFTVGAQALNFVVLVWLMKRFLYGPILKAVESRDARLAAEFADASAKQLEAQEARDEFTHKNEELERQRDDLFREAAEEAGSERERLLTAAREAAAVASAGYQRELSASAEATQRALAERTQTEVFAIARQVLGELAGASLEECLTAEFIRRLGELGGPAKAELGKALRSATDPALVRSAFDLPAAQREALQAALDEAFALETSLEFETAPDIVCGIELSTGGQKLAWSIAEYLQSLGEAVRELVEEQQGPVPAAVAEAPEGASRVAEEAGARDGS